MKIVVNGTLGLAPGGDMTELPTSHRGVFETVLIREGIPVFFRDHWERFIKGCSWCEFDAPTSITEMERLAAVLVEANKLDAGVLRFAAWREEGRVEWRVEASPPRPHMARTTFGIGFSDLRLPASTSDRHFKHLNRGLWLEGLRAARDKGWDETVFLGPAGEVVEGGVSNLFFVRDARLFTPALDTGPLPGVMRARLLAVAATLRIPLVEGVFGRKELGAAEEIWLSNSLIGVRVAATLGDRHMATATPILDRLRGEWSKVHGWDPVVVASRG